MENHPYKTLADTYLTRQTYDSRENIKEPQYRPLSEAYAEVYNKQHLIWEGASLSSAQLNKWKVRGDDRLANFIKKLEDGDTFVSSKDNAEDVGPIDYDPEWLDRVKSSGNVHTTFIPLKGGGKILLKDLAKTAEFGGQGQGTSKDTDIKEGLVTLFFVAGGLVEKVTKENYHKVRIGLKKILDEKTIYEEDEAKRKLQTYLGDKEMAKPMAADLHEMNQPLSQARTMIDSPYKDWTATRGTLFEKIRRIGVQITNFPADKWCPGDIYFINPELEHKIDEAVRLIESQPQEESNLKTLNDLFVNEWGDTDRPIMAISLKFANAQGGKAKDFLRTFLEAGTRDRPYNVAPREFEMDTQSVGQSILSLRSNISNYINTKSSDVDIDYDVQMSLDGLEDNEKRLREKHASLKLIDFLFDQADIGRLDDTIVAAIGFGMSLTGINPTFFKVIANKQGNAIENPEKFSEGGVIALYPNEGEPEPRIRIKDYNTSNKVEINCNVELGDEIKQVMLSARSNGGKQATLENEKIHDVGEL